MWTVPEHVKVYLHGLHEYPIHPSVEVFVVGVILGQLVGCSLWPAGMTEASYWLMLSGGGYQMPVSSHASVWVLLPCAHCSPLVVTDMQAAVHHVVGVLSIGISVDVPAILYLALSLRGVCKLCCICSCAPALISCGVVLHLQITVERGVLYADAQGHLCR